MPQSLELRPYQISVCVVQMSTPRDMRQGGLQRGSLVSFPPTKRPRPTSPSFLTARGSESISSVSTHCPHLRASVLKAYPWEDGHASVFPVQRHSEPKGSAQSPQTLTKRAVRYVQCCWWGGPSSTTCVQTPAPPLHSCVVLRCPLHPVRGLIWKNREENSTLRGRSITRIK